MQNVRGDLVLTPDSSIAECESCGTVQAVPTADNEKTDLIQPGEPVSNYDVYEVLDGVYYLVMDDKYLNHRRTIAREDTEVGQYYMTLVTSS